jgi:hypothetical protein
MSEERKELNSTDLLALVCFLAKVHNQVDQLRYKVYSWRPEDGDLRDYLVGQWPVIQGTKNQFDLEKIGEIEFDHTRIRKAVDAILSANNKCKQPIKGD